MNISEKLVQEAMEQHRRVYAEKERGAWEVSHHAGLWTDAHAAFYEGSAEHFKTLYNELRGRWQVFRGGAGSHWTVEEVYEHLKACDAKYKTARLSELTFADASGLWGVLQEMRGIKVNRDGPAVVAISKFLHFLNPKLFVIVDFAMIWDWVFRHEWLWRPVEKVRKQLQESLPGAETIPVGASCDLVSYLAILLWAGTMVKDNPTILAGFKEYLTPGLKGMALAGEFVQYEAVAFEWFLLGVVEVPPDGIGCVR